MLVDRRRGLTSRSRLRSSRISAGFVGSDMRQERCHHGCIRSLSRFTGGSTLIWNAKRAIALVFFLVQDADPTDEWKGRQSFTNDVFNPQSVPICGAASSQKMSPNLFRESCVMTAQRRFWDTPYSNSKMIWIR